MGKLVFTFPQNPPGRSICRHGEPSPWNIIQEWSVMIIGEHEDAFGFDFDEVLLLVLLTWGGPEGHWLLGTSGHCS